MTYRDPEKQRAWARAHYERNRQKRIDASKRRQDVKRWRAKRKTLGLKANGDYERRLKEYVNAAAKRGREYWPRGCRVALPKWEPPKVEKPRKPWHDPTLTKSEQWKLRYRLDPDFHAKEYQKALRRKRARRKLMAESGLPPWRVALLRIQCQSCAYCGTHLPDVTQRMVDHVMPVHKGGQHEWDNLAVVCESCNARKHARLPTAAEVRSARRQRDRCGGQLPLLCA